MAPSLLLTTLAPALTTPDDSRPFSTNAALDGTKRSITTGIVPPAVAPVQGPASISSPSSSAALAQVTAGTDASERGHASSHHASIVNMDSPATCASGTRYPGRSLACPWSGAPIRAIVPLPRRKHCGASTPDVRAQDSKPSTCGTATRRANGAPASAGAATAPGLSCHTTLVWDDATDSSTDSGVEHDGSDGGDDDEVGAEAEEGKEDHGSDGDRRGAGVVSRHCSFESITAAQGLSAWSFEELRLECYAQSLVARGTKPPPVVQLSLAIPPAFVPRRVRLPRI